MSAAGRLQQLILDEVAVTFGAAPDGLVRRICGSVFALPTGRFARHFAAADREVGRAGLSSGCGRLLSDMGIGVAARGTECLPTGSPLLVVANHPGAYDSVALALCIPRRDLKIFLYEVPFFRAIPNASGWFIYATSDANERATALRATIRHLQGGGSVVLFGTGIIEPDPALGPGAIAALGHWSRSIEILMRRVPGVRLVLAAVSGVMTPAFVSHPLRLIRQKPVDRRRVAEYLQVITQMVFPRRFSVTVRLSFAPPVTIEELSRESQARHLMPAILARECRLLEEHRSAWHEN
jgi:1-acyl-sn-glycerol-3-phosphate acyltransferase